MLTLEHLAALYHKHEQAAQTSVTEFSLGKRHLAFNSAPIIMGVINLSADSWYRESVCLTVERAIERARVLHAQGATIVDIGAESTLLQATRVSEAMQQSKLVPVLEGLRETGPIVSIETYHAKVARKALEAGAQVINLTGTEESEEIFRLAAKHEAAVIICFVEGANVRQVTDLSLGEDPAAMTYEYFARQIEKATAAGATKIIIDPGLGFYYSNLQDSATRVRYQMTTFLNTFRLRTLGFPVCHALPHAFEFFGEEVRSAEGFFAVLAALGKTDLFRTHEVPRIKAVLDTLRIY